LLAAALRRLRDQGRPSATALVRRAHADGSWRWLEAVLVLLRDDGGAVCGVHSVARDVTARVHAEESRAEAEQRFRGLVEQGPDAVLVHLDGHVAYANPAAARLTGAAAADELLGLPLVDLTDPALGTALRAHVRTVLRGVDAGLLRQRLRRLDGSWCAVEISSALVVLDGRIGVQHVARPVAPGVGADVVPLPGPVRDHLRVLVADDSDTSRMVARALLAAEHADVVTVADGDEAVDAVADAGRGDGFDLVLLDVRMPRMSGPEAARAIRALPGGAGRTPLLALTAAAGEQDRAECLAAGMGGVLVKPVRRTQLRQVLTEVAG
jgi:PAS domain S-box-containing protein